MRKFIVVLCMLFTLCSVSAQTAYESPKILDNTSLSVIGGASTPLDFNSVFPLNGVAGLKLQKDFTPVVGLNVEGSAVFGDNHYGTASTVVRAVNVGLNGTVNLSNLLLGYNGTPRKFELSTETGLGWEHSWTGHANYLTAKTGLVGSFNLDKARAHSIIINPAVYWNLSQSGKIQFNNNHAQLALLVGYVYHFKTSNGTHSFKTYNIGELNDRINYLQGELTKKPREAVREIVKTETVTNTVGNVIVCFAKNSSELTATAMSQLSQIPEGSTVSIVGEASPEGSDQYNVQLSEKRASVVAEFLKQRNVNVDTFTGIGSTNTASNRIATVVLK